MTMEQFDGTWEILELGDWDKDDLDAAETAYIHLNGETGKFHFADIDGDMDVEYMETGIAFSWLGQDEIDMSCGRGWGVLDDDERLRGMFYFHGGAKTTFVATPMRW